MYTLNVPLCSKYWPEDGLVKLKHVAKTMYWLYIYVVLRLNKPLYWIMNNTMGWLLSTLGTKFIKSSSKSKALIHYPTGCPRRQWTPDLFISSYPHCMDPADPPGNLSWSSQSFTHHQILCDIFHGIHDVQEMQVSIMMSQHRVGAQAVIRCAQFGNTWPPWQWQRGWCTTPIPTNTLIC